MTLDRRLLLLLGSAAAEGDHEYKQDRYKRAISKVFCSFNKENLSGENAFVKVHTARRFTRTCPGGIMSSYDR